MTDQLATSSLYHRDRALERAARAFIEAFELAEGDYFNEAPESVYEAYERLLEALK